MAKKLKLFIPHAGIDGIRRVYEAQERYLSDFGVELVKHKNKAHVIATHGTTLETSASPHVPMVNHNHGLYWSRQEWGATYHNVNFQVTRTMVNAMHVTAPSEWVATALRRGIMRPISVIYHGVDYAEWEHDFSHGNYVLWNKGRADEVSNPNDMNDLAAIMPNVRFRSTFGLTTKNVEITGRMEFEDMKPMVQRAGVYLATARETFGIGTLEAMAAGIPIAGWDWGGQSEIILQGETGYLASPGNYEELAECVQKCYEERDRLSKNCQMDVQERWRWEDKIEKYANLYKSVHKRQTRKSPKVGVVVSAYDLDEYLDDCLQSVADQTMDDWECVVIDDALQDSTQEIVEKWASSDDRFRYVRPKENMGLAKLRNFSLGQTDAYYIRHLDADDMLGHTALELEANHLDKNWGDWIVYGHLVNMSQEGEASPRGDWPPNDFNWHLQMAHYNCLPSCVMARREVYEWTGGYRVRNWRNEDAHFWCLSTSFGMRAKKITQAITYYHRDYPTSKGATEWREHGPEYDWTSWFPWRKGARTSQDGWKVITSQGKKMPDGNLVPFGAQGAPPEDLVFWPVHDYAYPVVSVIITVGPGHEKYLVDAADSVLAQSYPDWQMIIVNDTGKEWANDYTSPAAGHPWAKIVSTGGKHNAAHARNLGAQYATGEAMIWLDADDYWLPNFLERMVAMWEANNGIIYSDWFKNENVGDNTPLSVYENPPFECGRITGLMSFAGTSILIPRWVWDIVYQEQGGWDEIIPGMEDWDFQFAAHAFAGVCAYQIPEPLFVYRFLTTTKREKDYNIVEDIKAYMQKKWSDYYEGKKTMGCGCRKPKSKRVPTSRLNSTGTNQNLALEDGAQETPQDAMVLLEYHGDEIGRTYIGRNTNQKYRFGKNESNRVAYVFQADVDQFLRMGNKFSIFSDTPPIEQPDTEDFVGQSLG